MPSRASCTSSCATPRLASAADSRLGALPLGALPLGALPLGALPDADAREETSRRTIGVGCLGGVPPVRPRPPASALSRSRAIKRKRPDGQPTWASARSRSRVTMQARTDAHPAPASGLRAGGDPTPPSAAACPAHDDDADIAESRIEIDQARLLTLHTSPDSDIPRYCPWIRPASPHQRGRFGRSCPHTPTDTAILVIPIILRAVPSALRAVPSALRAVPSALRAVPSAVAAVRVAIAHICVIALPVPLAVATVRVAIAHICVIALPVPLAVFAVHTAESASPAAARPVPASDLPVPASARPVPASDLPVPAAARPVHAVDSGVHASKM
jgi:hypothetical protein